MSADTLTLIEKLDQLPSAQVAEVEDFIDFLRQRWENRQLGVAATQASEASFARIWDNPEDAAYDEL